MWFKSRFGGLVACAIQSAVAVGIIWGGLALGCKIGALACFQLEWQLFAIGFVILFFAFIAYYERTAVKLREAKEEHYRKYGPGL